MTDGTVGVGVPAETAPGETRVAMTPEAVGRLSGGGMAFAVQSGAGRGAFHSDDDYRDAGAEIVPDAGTVCRGAEVVVKVAPPLPTGDGSHEVDLLGEGTILVSFLRPRSEPELLERLARAGVTAFALELLPRVTRAQSMDALSSMATLAGYKAVLVGASSLPRLFPLLMTAAGTVSPARVLVLGAGVAGLQAIATAKRLGAVVWGYDIRPAVKEQVESLGARFVELQEEEGAAAAGGERGAGGADGGGAGEESAPAPAAELETAGGYAVELAEDEQARQRRLLARHVEKADVVVTTALIPGRPAPLLITEEAVEAMRPGSVIVDLAAEAGGNCALTEPGESVERHGVTIHGPLNLPASLPAHASQMYARNLSSFLQHLVSEGEVRVDLEDEILGPCCVTHAGEVRFRP